MTYVAEIKEKAASEAEIEHEEYIKNVNDNLKYSSMENQRLDYIYDDEPLGFEKDPMGPSKRMQAQDPLQEVDLGDGTFKRPTYISTKIDREFKVQIVELL
jgi:hypothetical protein